MKTPKNLICLLAIVVSTIVFAQQQQNNRWFGNTEITNSRIDGGLDIVSLNEGTLLFASSFENLAGSARLSIYQSNDEGENWGIFFEATPNVNFLKMKMLMLNDLAGDDYLLVYTVNNNNLLRVRRFNLSQGTPVESQVVAENVADFDVDRNWPGNTSNHRVFLIYQTTSNDILTARTQDGTFGFDYVDFETIAFGRSMPSIAYGVNGSLYVTYVRNSNGDLNARHNTNYLDPANWNATEVLEDGSVRESLNPKIVAERESGASENVLVITSSRGTGSGGKYNIRRYRKIGGANFTGGVTNASPGGISYLYMDGFINYSWNANVQIGYLRQSIDGSQNNSLLYRVYDGSTLSTPEFATPNDIDLYDGFQPFAITTIRSGAEDEALIVYTDTSADGTHAEGLYFDRQSSVLSLLDIDIEAIKLYPNPANQYINIAAPQNDALHSLKIYDSSGKLIKTVAFKNLTTTQQLDISNLASGVYFINIQTAQRQETKKIIIN